MATSGKHLRKRLFVNLDGTGQAEFTAAGRTVDGKTTSPPVSNVARIGRAIALEDGVIRKDGFIRDDGYQQVVYYLMGVGADAETGQGFAQAGWGRGVISNVRSAYGFICNNYDFGDEIYITGFSRGAFTARSVAGFIGKCGILTKKGLELFYETAEWYKTYHNYTDKDRPKRPVSEAAGTTREKDPETGDPIKIRAVGVWDTVGALDSSLRDVKWRWHDVELRDHIENAYQVLALEDHRYYYNCNLWESPNRKIGTANFEQVWMAGDHSNIGGSWNEQQLSDISLAWMISRFEALGVNFDQTYLFGEFRKFQKLFADGRSPGGDQGGPYPRDMTPRQWGEGRCHDVWYDLPIHKKWSRCGNIWNYDRPFGHYQRPKWTSNNRDTVEWTGGFLQNTNETIHPIVRYRNFCKRQLKLGHNDLVPFAPTALGKEIVYPRAQDDGRIGRDPGHPQAPSENPLSYTFTRKVTGKKDEEITYFESAMGKHELLYLAFYDIVDEGAAGLWEQVVGGKPDKQILDDALDIIKEYHKKYPESDHVWYDDIISKYEVYMRKHGLRAAS